MIYLEQMPHCPVCDRVLRRKNDRDWCVTCHAYVDEPVIPGAPG